MEYTIIFKIYLAYVAVLSFITLIIYGIDKVKAKNNANRVPEKTLLGLSALGGALGGFLAMILFKHKTKRWYFWFINILFLIVHISLAILIYVKI